MRGRACQVLSWAPQFSQEDCRTSAAPPNLFPEQQRGGAWHARKRQCFSEASRTTGR
jgi:hypothetical protein